MIYPDVNYIGNKEKLVSWIVSLLPEDIDSLFDAFAGGSSVSYAAKVKGLTVYSNDILKINYHIAKAIVENDSVRLNGADFNRIFSGEPKEGFMFQNYADKFYFPDECKELDLYRENIASLDNEYKQSLALALMRRAMIRKMPYSRFNIKWKKIQQLRDEQYSYEKYGRYRSYHNKSFKYHVADNVDDYNLAVFSNGKRNRAYNLDVYDAIDAVEADAIYIDPPYAGTMNDYFGFYGLLDSYVEGKVAEPFANNFVSTKTILAEFERLFSRLGKFRYWILSYNSRSKPGKEELLELLSRFSADIAIHEQPYAYRVTGKEKKKKDVEYLFIVRNEQ